MKGQLTLETIIMLVVLLVLAGVMITLILTTLKPPQFSKKSISKQQFIQECQSLCEAKNYGKYCSYYWDGEDWDGDNSPSEVIKVNDGTNDWLACEDRVYCFLVTTCDDLGYGRYKIEACVDHLYSANLQKFGDEKRAKEATSKLFSFSLKCSYSKFQSTVKSASSVSPEVDWYGEIVFAKIGTFPEESISTTTTSIPTPPPPPPEKSG
jgi:Na+-transporting NADH:ubiquinone oxidoreductase subunit NqrC